MSDMLALEDVYTLALEGVRRADGRIAVFYGDAFVGHVSASEQKNAPHAPTPRMAGKRAAPAPMPSAGGRGKNTGVLRRCQTCSAKTKRTICPNGHRVTDDPE